MGLEKAKGPNHEETRLFGRVAASWHRGCCASLNRQFMSRSNPFIPAGALMAERQRRNRTQFKVGVFAVLAAHAMLLTGLLIQGCRSDGSSTTSASEPAESTGLGAASAPEAPAAAAAAVPVSPVPAPIAVAAEVPSTQAPGVTASPALADPYYLVKAGDTLARIARVRGTTVKALKAANHLSDDRLSVGQKLILPPPRPPASA